MFDLVLSIGPINSFHVLPSQRFVFESKSKNHLVAMVSAKGSTTVESKKSGVKLQYSTEPVKQM